MMGQNDYGRLPSGAGPRIMALIRRMVRQGEDDGRWNGGAAGLNRAGKLGRGPQHLPQDGMGLTQAPSYEEFYSKQPPVADRQARRDDYLIHGRRHTADELAEAERRAGDLRLVD